MLSAFVIGYLVVSIAIGLLASLRVHNSRDFVSAGRSLPLSIVTATMFATWFGSESVLGAPPTFLQEGIGSQWRSLLLDLRRDVCCSCALSPQYANHWRFLP